MIMAQAAAADIAILINDDKRPRLDKSNTLTVTM